VTSAVPPVIFVSLPCCPAAPAPRRWPLVASPCPLPDSLLFHL